MHVPTLAPLAAASLPHKVDIALPAGLTGGRLVKEALLINRYENCLSRDTTNGFLDGSFVCM
jgi:hypothetical protein